MVDDKDGPKTPVMIGIDPGVTTGVANMDPTNGKVSFVWTSRKGIGELLDMIAEHLDPFNIFPKYLAVEVPRAIHYKRHEKNTSKEDLIKWINNQIVISQKVGQVIGRSKCIVEWGKWKGYTVIEIPPANKNTKWDAAKVKATYGIYPTNEHNRDAIATCEMALRKIRSGEIK